MKSQVSECARAEEGKRTQEKGLGCASVWGKSKVTKNSSVSWNWQWKGFYLIQQVFINHLLRAMYVIVLGLLMN